MWKKLLAHVEGVNLQNELEPTGEDVSVEETVHL
jgi:hypothetical protein